MGKEMSQPQPNPRPWGGGEGRERKAGVWGSPATGRQKLRHKSSQPLVCALWALRPCWSICTAQWSGFGPSFTRIKRHLQPTFLSVGTWGGCVPLFTRGVGRFHSLAIVGLRSLIPCRLSAEDNSEFLKEPMLFSLQPLPFLQSLHQQVKSLHSSNLPPLLPSHFGPS